MRRKTQPWENMKESVYQCKEQQMTTCKSQQVKNKLAIKVEFNRKKI